MEIIWLTDLHFSSSELVFGIDTNARVDAALRHINKHYAKADLCILSGDLVNQGLRSDYERLRKLLDTLPMPWYPMTGNHDDRTLLRQSLLVPEGSMDNFIQYALTFSTHDIICLDTLRDGRSDGEICTERLSWLNTQIKAAGNKPVYLFMHHPPMKLNLPMQDFESFKNREKFIESISIHSNLQYIFAGHVHRAVSGQIAGIPYTTMRSLSFQAPAPFPEWTWETFEPANESPGYGVISMHGDAVNIQFIEY